ncbi:PerC family transcriptional regulator [Salmonella enterica]|nr:PerC family transcriptional regulator [Salmonella enterica]EJJ4347308.1 PerC family transcriptional regulator [Salmonella enterica]
MSLLANVQTFIGLNPGLTSNEIADAFPEYDRLLVQRSASKLYRCRRVKRELHGKVFRYYAGKGEAVILTLRQKKPRAASRYTGSGDPKVIAALVSRAEALEAKGLFNRAAKVWMEAFDESLLINEREALSKRRQKCFESCKKPVRPGEQIYLAGRFVGNVE